MFDSRRAQRVIQFVENLKHTKGESPRARTFALLPWQETNHQRRVRDQCRDDRPDVRQYQRRHTSKYGKKNRVKPSWARRWRCTCSVDGRRVEGAEVYGCASTTAPQASIVFDVAARYGACSRPLLMKRIKIVPNPQKRHGVSCPPAASIRCCPATWPASTVCNVQRVHLRRAARVSPPAQLFDVMTTGLRCGARSSRCGFVLTTAGQRIDTQHLLGGSACQSPRHSSKAGKHDRTLLPGGVLGCRTTRTGRPRGVLGHGEPVSSGCTVDLEKAASSACHIGAGKRPRTRSMFRQLRL